MTNKNALDSCGDGEFSHWKIVYIVANWEINFIFMTLDISTYGMRKMRTNKYASHEFSAQLWNFKNKKKVARVFLEYFYDFRTSRCPQQWMKAISYNKYFMRSVFFPRFFCCCCWINKKRWAYCACTFIKIPWLQLKC